MVCGCRSRADVTGLVRYDWTNAVLVLVAKVVSAVDDDDGRWFFVDWWLRWGCVVVDILLRDDVR